ncbi:MAG: hypothetical protein IT464_12135 [Planctomycetes bacterium]|nr:hypothetical protein [Planctomycetota bacterium]
MKVLGVFILFLVSIAGAGYGGWWFALDHQQRKGTLTLPADQLLPPSQAVEERIRLLDEAGTNLKLTDEEKRELRQLMLDKEALAVIANSFGEMMEKYDVKNMQDLDRVSGREESTVQDEMKGLIQAVLINYSERVIGIAMDLIGSQLGIICMRRVRFEVAS